MLVIYLVTSNDFPRHLYFPRSYISALQTKTTRYILLFDSSWLYRLFARRENAHRTGRSVRGSRKDLRDVGFYEVTLGKIPGS